MGFNVPILNCSSDAVRAATRQWADQPQNQKKLVLVIVSVALLLDNMLYMVIVPIIPKYLRDIHAYEAEFYAYHNETVRLPNGMVMCSAVAQIDYLNEDIELGWLFGSKAMLQIFVSPLSGFINDRVGYEIPMIVGLVVMFISTVIFALGRSYGVLLLARSLQGFGSAFVATSGLAMIVDRFSEEGERSDALGIALAFETFGYVVALPFGSVLYSLAGKPVPFLILSFVCLADALAIFTAIHPGRRGSADSAGDHLKGTPMWRLLMDPMIAVCSGALVMSNVSLAFLEPTITNWMADSMPSTPVWQMGMIWLPAFFPQVLGVYVTVRLLKAFPNHTWLIAIVGLSTEGMACFAVPYMTSVTQLIIPLSFVCFGIALMDTSLMPMLGHLVDTRHVPLYGSVYAIADISYSLAYTFGPVIAGWIVENFGFFELNMIIFLSNVFYAPVIAILREVNMSDSMGAKSKMTAVKNDSYAETGYVKPVTETTPAQGFHRMSYGTTTSNYHVRRIPRSPSGETAKFTPVAAAATLPDAAQCTERMDSKPYCCYWYDRCLPKPPVPSFDHTLERYKEYAEVVAEGVHCDIQSTLDAIDEFRIIGMIYQQQLEKIAEDESNWINQFWLPEMYLRMRLPLPVNSSAAAILPQQYFESHDDWLRYTALMIRGLVEYKDKIDTRQQKSQRHIRMVTVSEPTSGDSTARELLRTRSNKTTPQLFYMCWDSNPHKDWSEKLYKTRQLLIRSPDDSRRPTVSSLKKQLEPEVSIGKVKVKMCMQQYDQIFSSYRRPSREEDVQIVKEKRNNGNEHILVISRNQAFVVHTRNGGHLLSFADIFFQLQQVIRMSHSRKHLVVPVGAATAGDRQTAARFWEILCKLDVNRVSLTWAQEALFVVSLDDEDREAIPSRTWPEDHERDVGSQGKHILTGGSSRGHGLNRCYDSTIQSVVGSSGTNGLCIEHSPVEGIVIINMVENALRYERDMKRTLVAEIYPPYI